MSAESVAVKREHKRSMLLMRLGKGVISCIQNDDFGPLAGKK